MKYLVRETLEYVIEADNESHAQAIVEESGAEIERSASAIVHALTDYEVKIEPTEGPS